MISCRVWLPTPRIEVDIAYWKSQQVADGEDVGPFQRVRARVPKAHAGNRRLEVGLFQRVTRRSTSSPAGVLIFRCSASVNTCCHAQRISSALWKRCSGSRWRALRKKSTRPSRTLGSNFSASMTSSSSVRASADLPEPRFGRTPAPSRHLVQRDRRREAFRGQVPTLWLTVDQKHGSR